MCIAITCADIGRVSGLLDLPRRTIILSRNLGVREGVEVAQALLERAGITQDNDSAARCICGVLLDPGAAALDLAPQGPPGDGCIMT